MRNSHATRLFEMWMRSLAITILCCAACKSSSSEATVKPATGSSSAASGAIEHLSTNSGDGAAAAAVATRYVQAMVRHDWAAACATRPAHEREEMARVAGSCEQAFSAITANQPTEILAHVASGDVRRRGEMIAVDMNQPGQTKPMVTLILTREGSAWVVVDVPDDQNF
jgi:hypothetical protein